MANPFKPTAGADPPLLVGRGDLIDEFLESIEDGPGAPLRLAFFTGPRGVGKTVLLNALGELVQGSRQWLVIHETATEGFLERLTASAVRALGQPSKRYITGVSLPSVMGTGGGGVDLSAPSGQAVDDYRQAMGQLLDVCEPRGTGVLITLDEVHADRSAELVQFAAAHQHLIRESREVALAMAGLPAAVDDLLAEAQITFLRRAERRDLGDVPLEDVAAAFRDTIEANGRSIADEALDRITAATGGYPFMIQLVGYQVWRKATSDHIDINAANVGVEQARTRLGSLVHAPALRDLSDVDRTFLASMASDDGPSKVSNLARRMQKEPGYVGVYRARLLAAGVIRSVRFGEVDFAIPYLRDYLRDHVVTQAPRDGR